MEKDFALVPCLAPEDESCAIGNVCRLAAALREACGAFLETLSRYTLADLVPHRRRLVRLPPPAPARDR